MVPSDRALWYRLSIVTMSPSAAVGPQFSMEGFNKWPYLGNSERKASLIGSGTRSVRLNGYQ